MRSYQVTAIDTKGNTVSEVVNAESIEDLAQAVKSKSLYMLEYQEAQKAGRNVGNLRTKSLVIFARQLGTMIKAGIPVIQALDMLVDKADTPKARKIYRNVYEEVQKGNTLSIAMESQKGVFPDLLVNMVSAGELGGTLDNSLSLMADHYDKELKLSNKIKSASIYPAILGLVSVVVVLLLVIFVLPTITSMFDPENMPWTTAIILAISNFIINNWMAIIAVLVAIGIVIRFMLKVRTVRVRYDRFILFMPVIGKLAQTIYSARAARTLSSLYSSGVKVIDILETTGRVLNNTYLENMFKDIIAAVSRGELISKAIDETGAFDPMLSSMIYVGEETGSLGDILSSTADYFDNEAESALQRLVSMIEPAMIIILGIVIGFIVISIIQPIFQMYESIV